jgi:hypothetical protein
MLMPKGKTPCWILAMRQANLQMASIRRNMQNPESAPEGHATSAARQGRDAMGNGKSRLVTLRVLYSGLTITWRLVPVADVKVRDYCFLSGAMTAFQQWHLVHEAQALPQAYLVAHFQSLIVDEA